jgi:CBS domain containing-hemolysin-like protein
MGNALSKLTGWVKNFFLEDKVSDTPPPQSRSRQKPELSAAPSPAPKPTVTAPQTKAELVKLLKSLPDPVLSAYEKHSISAVMSFGTKKVAKIMTPKSDLVFVGAEDYLGPLTLDKLHRTGHIHFLVRGTAGRIVGTLHIRNLLNLKIKESDKAKTYLDKNLCYIRDDYSLDQALATFLRTGSLMAIVVNREANLTGILLLEDLVLYLLGREAIDHFDDDYNIDAVASRN